MTKPAKRAHKADSLGPLRAALKKRTKDELIDVVVQLAKNDRTIQREPELRFGVQLTDTALVSDTWQAIVDATNCDECQMNHNFDYDYGAYKTVERHFAALIKAGQLEQVMELAFDLMRRGSYQVEMIDEGLMTEDVEACLQVVLRAVEKSKLPPTRIVAWCDALQNSDRVGFILDKESMAVKNRFVTAPHADIESAGASMNRSCRLFVDNSILGQTSWLAYSTRMSLVPGVTRVGKAVTTLSPSARRLDCVCGAANLTGKLAYHAT